MLQPRFDPRESYYWGSSILLKVLLIVDCFADHSMRLRDQCPPDHHEALCITKAKQLNGKPPVP